MADWLANLDTDIINPEPVVLEEPDVLISGFLSPAKLQEISGQEDLESVDSIEMVVNTAETTLGNFGQYLPSLSLLKLNNSFIPTVRDIGTAFNSLTVLWMSRSRVNEVDGIGSMRSLQELYISYNNISDLSPISFLDNLEVLDLEANRVSDIDQLDYLSIICSLTTLTLSSNPVCQYYNKETKQNFRQYVLSRLPNLQQLDDISSSVSDLGNQPGLSLQEDFEIITNAIKAVNLENEFDPSTSNNSSFATSFNATKCILPSSFSLTPLKNLNRPRTASAAANSRKPIQLFENELSSSLKTTNTRPGSSDSDSGIMLSDDSSALTFGNPLCGNPIQALKQRRKGPVPAFTFLHNDLKEFIPEITSRPSTSLGFRTVSQDSDCRHYGYWKCQKFKASEFENISTNTNDDLPCTSKEHRLSSKISDASKNNDEFTHVLFDEESVSSPSQKQPTSPFRSPTPPQSPQRPNSARNYRLLRRSFQSNTNKQTVNIMTVSSVEKSYKQADSIQPSLKDQSA